MGGLNESLAMPQAPHSLTEMPPMEALYAAFAGASGDAHHELTLDPAAMNIHDGDEVISQSRLSFLNIPSHLGSHTRHVSSSSVPSRQGSKQCACKVTTDSARPTER